MVKKLSPSFSTRDRRISISLVTSTPLLLLQSCRSCSESQHRFFIVSSVSRYTNPSSSIRAFYGVTVIWFASCEEVGPGTEAPGVAPSITRLRSPNHSRHLKRRQRVKNLLKLKNELLPDLRQLNHEDLKVDDESEVKFLHQSPSVG